MKKLLLSALLALGFVAPAHAQQAASALILSACGTLPAGLTYAAGQYGIQTMDTTGKSCSGATFSGSVSATTAATSQSTLPTLTPSASSPIYESLGAGLYVQPVFGSASGGGTQVDATHGLPVNVIAGGAGGGAVFGPTAAGSAAANPPVLVGGTIDGTATGNVSVNKVVAGIAYLNTAQVNGVTTLAGAGAVGTGSQRVAVGQDTTTIAGSAPGTAGTASANVLSVQGIASMTPFLANPGTAANWGVGATAGAVPANAQYFGVNISGNLVGPTGLALGATTKAPTVAIVDGSGNQITAFGGSGGTASNFGSTFPTAGTAIGLTNGTNMVAWSATANYGTPPGAIAVPAVNAAVTTSTPEGAVGDSAWVSGNGSIIAIAKTIATNTGSAIPAGSAVIGALTANQSVNLSQVNGVTTLTGTGATGPGAQRVTVSTDQATNAGAALVKGGVGVVNGGSRYQAVAASATATVLQSSTGATGDYLSHCVIYPQSTSPGVVTVFDGSNSAGNSAILFAGGATSVSNLAPIPVPVGAISRNGAWEVTTGTNVSVVCYGSFS